MVIRYLWCQVDQFRFFPKLASNSFKVYVPHHPDLLDLAHTRAHAHD